MVTAMCEANYIALAPHTKQWIWLMITFEELDVLVTNTAMICNNKAGIDISYKHKNGLRSQHIDIAYRIVGENVESECISVLQVESAHNLAHIYTKGPLQVTLQKPRTAIMHAK
jgi:hypothetical protein